MERSYLTMPTNIRSMRADDPERGRLGSSVISPVDLTNAVIAIESPSAAVRMQETVATTQG